MSEWIKIDDKVPDNYELIYMYCRMKNNNFLQLKEGQYIKGYNGQHRFMQLNDITRYYDKEALEVKYWISKPELVEMD